MLNVAHREKEREIIINSVNNYLCSNKWIKHINDTIVERCFGAAIRSEDIQRATVLKRLREEFVPVVAPEHSDTSVRFPQQDQCGFPG